MHTRKGEVARAASGASPGVSGATAGAATGSASLGTAITSSAAVGVAGGFAILAQDPGQRRLFRRARSTALLTVTLPAVQRLLPLLVLVLVLEAVCC